jgi:hypothetical protein
MRSLCIISATLFFLVATDVLGQEAQITVQVTNESGSPVTNATVHAGFATAIKPGWGWGAGNPNRVEGTTDTNGVCTLQGEGNGGSVGIAAFKDGYYGSSGYLVVFTNLTGTIARKWEPWNPTVNVILKPVGNPIPMYAKSFRDGSLPVSDQPVGFDLMAGDWVAPHGKGQEPDLLFTFSAEPERVHTNWYGSSPRIHRLLDYNLAVSFFNEGDGVVPVSVTPHQGGSALRLPSMAPESGYSSLSPKRVYQQEGKPQRSDIQEDQNYFFRVRTKKDDKGNIVNALYGKIYGDFQFDERGRVTFTYYLNPTPNDRNVEFDPAKNLFTGLSSREQVHEP